jgi:Na+-translocating ferredoxin:NAD+ oxidoreductase subunit G
MDIQRSTNLSGGKALRRYGALALALVAVVAVVSAIASLTAARIDANRRAWFVARLDALLPPQSRDNDVYSDRAVIRTPELGADPVTVYRARLNGQPAGVVAAVAADGYGGPIELLIAIDPGGKLLGVDIVRHSETQGIGDQYFPQRSHGLRQLSGRSLGDPGSQRWTIAKDGGAFDQFTGASITPRAILKTVRTTLEYYALHRNDIYGSTS